MTLPRAIIVLVLGWVGFAQVAPAQQQMGEWEIKALHGTEPRVEWQLATGRFSATDGVMISYGGAVLTADEVTADEKSGEVLADGHVRIQRYEQIWVSDHMRYNFKTQQIESRQFRTGKAPVFAAGENLHAERTNKIYTATNAFITSDDISDPAIKVRASSIRVIPGEKIEAHNAVLYAQGVPIFYFPYYSRRLGPRANNFNFLPGYRSSYGPFLLSSYRWFLDEQIDGLVHADYRQKRGPGVGPDVNFHLGPWGEGAVKYYYAHDQDPQASVANAVIPADRQRVHLEYQANPATNLYVKSMVRYQTDTNVLRDFLESEYRENPQPNTYFDVNRFWQNFSLDAYAEPRLNNFLETVERLPDVRLTGYRQELGASPLYYESQSSAGYYRRLFPNHHPLNGLTNYSSSRADSFHQLLLPMTFFGWLNVIPRVGGRATYYSDADGPDARSGAGLVEGVRGVFNTGAELSFKASRVWPQVQSDFWDADGLRHIIQPSINYVYVPQPNYRPYQLSQFDYESPSLRLLPIDFPDYNNIDAIDSQNVIRLGLFNKLQTKRQGQVANLVSWDLYTDWRLETRTNWTFVESTNAAYLQKVRANQDRFSDVYSDVTVKPRSWLTLESLTRYDPNDGRLRMAYHALTLEPNDIWSWTVGHFYLHDDDFGRYTGLGEGNNLLTSSVFYRLNENWGLRASHRFEARDGRLQEQAYSIYRDLRSWTAALTFRALDNPTGSQDYTVAFSFSLKAFPHYALGSDTARPYSLLGN